MHHVAAPDRRIPALDGFRGLMTVFVLLSHYVAEIRGGFPRAGVGFVAVDGFFVLSGLLVGRLILDKGGAANFYRVFYARRVCRTFPIYLLCVGAALGAAGAAGLAVPPAVPGWSYLAFCNNLFMAARGAVGAEWLGPTWTMAVEEQFYLVAPALMLLTPRRRLPAALGAVVALAIALRALLLVRGADGVGSLVLLPTRADDLAIGLACAPLLRSSVDWSSPSWRAAPIALLLLFAALRAVGGPPFASLVGHTVLCAAVALFLMGVVRGAPEARRLEGRLLAFFGAASYAIYLTHMPILWFAHRLVLGTEPSLASLGGAALTAACVPATLAASLALTRFVEVPATAFGRRLKWDLPRAEAAAGPDARPEPPPPAWTPGALASQP